MPRPNERKIMYELTNQRFGKLLVLEKETTIKKNSRECLWFCLCDCGNTTIVRSYSLRSGGTKSCGCLKGLGTKGVNTKHAMSNTRTYHTWEQMKQRCLNPKATRYPTYGAVGVTVCSTWVDSFEQFLKDMGERPQGKTLDRINPFGNYEPGNCRWATYKEQVHNQRRNYNVSEEVRPLCWSELMPLS